MSDIKIPASELILNEDGSIYHLHLHPEQIAPTIITVGDQDRVAAISKHFDAIEHKVENREFFTHTGRIGNLPITVLSTGIGTDNIDIVFNELHALTAIDFNKLTYLKEPKSLDIIRLGTSGALIPAIPLDTVLLTEYAIGLEGLMNFYPYNKSEIELEMEKNMLQCLAQNFSFIKPYACKASDKLINQFKEDMCLGITATCQGFYHPQGRSISNDPHFNSILSDLKAWKTNENVISNFEMETAGILGLARYFGFNACSINLILANRANQTFSKNPALKINALIEKVLAKISL